MRITIPSDLHLYNPSTLQTTTAGGRDKLLSEGAAGILEPECTAVSIIENSIGTPRAHPRMNDADYGTTEIMSPRRSVPHATRDQPAILVSLSLTLKSRSYT